MHLVEEKCRRVPTPLRSTSPLSVHPRSAPQGGSRTPAAGASAIYYIGSYHMILCYIIAYRIVLYHIMSYAVLYYHHHHHFRCLGAGLGAAGRVPQRGGGEPVDAGGVRADAVHHGDAAARDRAPGRAPERLRDLVAAERVCSALAERVLG